MAKSYKEQLESQIEGLRKKLEKVDAAKSFATDPAGQIVYDWLQEQVTEIFAAMTADKPLSEEDYLHAHAAINIYRRLVRAITLTAASEARVQEEMKRATDQLTVNS